MNNSMINSLAGMQALQKKIDSIANNIANSNTVGYKSNQVYFEDILTSQLGQVDEFNLEGRKTPLGIEQGFGSKVNTITTDFSQGAQISTGVATDLMLQGDDIFFTVVSYDSTGAEEIKYTKDGHFQLDADGYLVTDQGDYVLDDFNYEVYIPENATFQIDRQGRITIEYNDGTSEERGALKISRIADPEALEKIGNSQYKVPEELINNNIEIVDNNFSLLNNQYGDKYSVVQGSLEGSNINLVEEMTQLTETQRAYQFQAKGLSFADQMLGMANNLKK